MNKELTDLCTTYKHFNWYECDLYGNSKSNREHFIIEWENKELHIDFKQKVTYVKFEFYIHEDVVDSLIMQINAASINLSAYILPSYHKLKRYDTYVNKFSNESFNCNTPNIDFNPNVYRHMTDIEYLNKIDSLIIRDKAASFIENNYMDLYLYAKYLEMEKDDLYLNGYKLIVSKL